MHRCNKAKKIILTFLLCVIVLIVPFNTLAITSGGAEITMTNGYTWIAGSGGRKNATSITNDYENGNYGITCVWGLTGLSNSYFGVRLVMCADFTFSAPNNYGTLSITVSPGEYGTIEIPNNSLIRDTTNDTVKLTPISIEELDSGDLRLKYTGYIPSSFDVVYYANFNSDASTGIGSIYYNISFTPVSELEQEKEQAESGGNDSVDELTGAIPDETDGLIDAFTNLTKSMIHTDTACKLNFPGIKIPAIKPFFDEIVLLGESEIDFEYYFTLIPTIYIKLIRALCTVTLVVYCFKELYSLLSFIFTAKGGGDSE